MSQSIEQTNNFFLNIKEIHYENFMVFKNFNINLENKNFICFFGPNGSGKTTILDSVQLLFSNFEGYDKDRLRNNLSRLIRHVSSDIYNSIFDNNSNFLLEASINSSLGDYEIAIDRNGFIKKHPAEVSMAVNKVCYYTRFDQELNVFQLKRNMWGKFKKLFESVTGYEIEEVEGVFNQSKDPIQAEILNQYVLSFDIKKPDETIRYTECSAGEKKVIKSFSTLLNKDISPNIILIDNIEMHVEVFRHINLVKAMLDAFPNSQIFSTTHSPYITKNYEMRDSLYDMRFIKEKALIKKDKWRLYLKDELKESIIKMMSIGGDVGDGNELLRSIDDESKPISELCSFVNSYINHVNNQFTSKILSYYGGSSEKNIS